MHTLKKISTFLVKRKISNFQENFPWENLLLDKFTIGKIYPRENLLIEMITCGKICPEENFPVGKFTIKKIFPLVKFYF